MTVSAQLPVVAPLQRALHLRSIDLFSDLGGRELAVFAELMHEQWLRRGELLHTPGQRVEAVHLLVEGRVRLEQQDQAVRRIEAPDGVGLVELLAQVETRTRALSETNSLALVVDGNAFLDVLEDHFSIFLQIRRALGQQVQAVQRQLAPAVPWQPPASSRKGPPPTAPLELAAQLIWLNRVPALQPFGVSVLASLIRDQGEVRLAPGEALWAMDSDAQFFMLVIDGVVRCGDDASGSFRAEAGTMVGLEAAFAGTVHPYAAVAETDVIGIRIHVPRLIDIAEDHFHVATRMLAHSARLLLRLQESEAANAGGKKSEEVAVT